MWKNHRLMKEKGRTGIVPEPTAREKTGKRSRRSGPPSFIRTRNSRGRGEGMGVNRQVSEIRGEGERMRVVLHDEHVQGRRTWRASVIEDREL